MTNSTDLDRLDRKILSRLQEDARLGNNDLSDLVALSPSQCSRRRQRLEEAGYIRGYRAELDRQKIGYEILAVISVTLATHNRDNAARFSALVRSLPEVMEAHALTGDMDYMLKVVTRNLDALSTLVNDALLPHETVQHVKTAVVLDTLKEGMRLPL